MLREVDRRRCAKIKVEELGTGEKLEVPVVEVEVVLGGLLLV